MTQKIVLKKVGVHNLKNVDLTLEPNQLIVFTGVSGSGKSSLAFDTIYVEGQRRYIESLSTMARRHLGEMPRPKAEAIEGISPTIAIEQKTAGRNPRSTVGTMTGIYDYLRLLYARVGIPHCPVSGEVVAPQSVEHILREIQKLPEKSKIIVLAPYAKGKKGEFKDEFAELLRKGYTRVRLDGKIIEIGDGIGVDGKVGHDLDLVIDRLVVRQEERGRLTEAVMQGLEAGKGLLTILDPDSGREEFFSEHAYSPKSGLSYGPLEPQDFSFNHPSGMCPTCHGLGTIQQFIVEKIIDPEKSIAEDCCSVGSSYSTIRFGNIYNNLARIYKFSVQTPWKDLAPEARKVFLYGVDKKWVKMEFVHPTKHQSWTEYVGWKGVLHEAHQRFQEATSDVYRQNMADLMEESLCSDCLGARIKPYPAATQFRGLTIQQLTALSIEKCLHFFETLSLSEEETIIAGELIKEIRERLFFLFDVGLHYLTLERTAPTLSGGEAQRVRLASQIGSGLSKATYVLDEPSIGLHPRDNTKLLASLRALCDRGNTVIVVEHDEETILAADHIVDVGPLAGKLGGEIIVSGTMNDLLQNPRSLTADYLTGRKKIEIPKRRPDSKKSIEIVGALHHNLKNVSVKIPLEMLVAVTGVSGSGKSSLITDILYPFLSNALHNASLKVGRHEKVKGIEEIDKVIAIDQSPIGRTPRSNPSTYIKLFDLIRDLFAKLPEAQAQGYKAGHFSFNVKEGSCPHCGGMGMIKIDMDFMEDEWATCEVCQGRRFDQKTLSVLYKGKSIYDVLEMTVSDALEFFDAIPSIRSKIELLHEVGLGYIKLGQSSPTLSGGEAQRIKLAKELSRPATGRTLYILDEPTTGLHFHDIAKLIDVLQKLVDKKNSVLVIEHNMDLVKTADWIIDLGPEGGDYGGEIVATGRPEKIAKMDTPTGKAVHKALNFEPLTVMKRPKKKQIEVTNVIEIEKAEQNNLKQLNLTIPHGKITICTGPSGSGKSSLAFETVYAEGQRRYIESMSAYARQYVKQMSKPKVEAIDGLLAAIAIEQKSHAGNPRSTIGTMTESYDYLRVLFAHLGTAYSPETGKQIRSISKEFVLNQLLELPENTKIQILAPLDLKEGFEQMKERLLKEGYLRIRLNKEVYELDAEIPFDKRRKNEVLLIVDRLTVAAKSKKRIYEAIDVAAKIAGNTLIVQNGDQDIFYNLAFADPTTGKSYPPITPHTFSFNTAQGMCMDCLGLGFQFGANLQKHRTIMRMSPYALMKKLWKDHAVRSVLGLFEEMMENLGIDSDCPLEKLPSEQLQIILSGSDIPLEKKGYRFKFIGLGPLFAKLAKSATNELKEELAFWVEQITCPSCQGTRLNPLARNVRIDKLSIADVCALPLTEAQAFIQKLKVDPLLDETLSQLKHRLHFMSEIGLGYLSLDRSAPTLSGGETQRIRLARQLGSWLTGCLYVLDEPTIGLHPHNNALLNRSLRKLCDQGNTLLMVEHDPMTIEIADHIIDFGPSAGKHGGQIIASGTLAQIKKNPYSLTGAYLSGKKKIPLPEQRRPFKNTIRMENAHLHNLKNLSVDLPIGIFTCVTGVSGSGKSTLINDLLRPAMQQVLATRKQPDSITYAGAHITGVKAFDKMLVIDQNPIGHTNRADISTYTDLSAPLRQFFAELPEAKARGLKPKNFSSNHLKGMCMKCWGLGKRKVEMQFLPPIRVLCDSCNGFRLNPQALQVKTKGKHLGQVLEMTVEETLEWLIPIPKAVRILETLVSVGLGYLQLGQEIATLSGGEAQRLRLARELSKRSTGKTLYLFDEPTIGLHSSDIVPLLKIFHSLVDRGNTVIIIEHNLDVIASADYVIDLGPEAGNRGGEIVCQGPPEDVAQHPKSYTARYLKGLLN
ncbi:MAG: excinuclease ABC subunit UvrA [Verrucomicrobia bacterium]|nr:excinuclease ABC subunit UvrA [Verrucomicrobiota bacterium]